MSELLVQGVRKSFGANELFSGVSFRVKKGERAGLVGANGAGKTTLMRIILGEEERDAGLIRLTPGASVGYAGQQASLSGGTIREEFLDAFRDIRALEVKKLTLEEKISACPDEALMEEYGSVVERYERLSGYDFESRMRRVAFGLGFSDSDMEGSTRHLSGGQRTRVALAKALIREPDFLFLDEPTNHLDIVMIEWLEGFLKDSPTGLLIISHDRFFLRSVATRIIDIENHTATVYEGSYDYFLTVKSARLASQKAAWIKQQEYIKKTEEYIRRYHAGIKAKQSRGRASQLKRMERITLPPHESRFDYFAFHPPAECAQRVLAVLELSIRFGDHEIFSNVSLEIKRGEGVGLVGANGTGKTTLLRAIVGELPPSSGEVVIGSRVKTGYFSQHHEGLHMERTVLDEILYEFDLDEAEARNYLGAFLFRGDEVYRLIGDLSGGEQSRLAFLKLMLTGANFLVLDEPTNHLDIPAKEAVEEALMTFPGTFIVVSHDRWFLDRVISRTVEISSGTITDYPGGYSYYRERKALAEEEAKDVRRAPLPKDSRRSSHASSSDGAQKIDRLPRAREKNTATIDASRREEMMRRAEAMIQMAEAELKLLDREMNDPSIQSDVTKSKKIAADYAAKEAEISGLYDEWAALSDDV